MSKRETLARYNLIIQKLRKKDSSFEEISDYLAYESELQDYDFNISKRTFQRDLKDIDSLYNIEIAYDFSRKVYYINYDDQTDINERILEAFNTFNALKISDRLSKHIHFEKRKPQGTDNLYGILHSIKNQLEIKFTYSKYWEEDVSFRQVQAYALKEFRNRWYILAKDLKDKQLKTFALDRLSDLEITKKQFEFPKNFDVNTYFEYCFGIIGPGHKKPEDVILSFTAYQGKYIKSLPLHESQDILIDNENELRVKLKVYATHDLFMELLSYGQELKVIKPKSLKNQLKSTLKKALEQYN